MRPSRTTWWILAAWFLLVGTYAAVSLLVRPGPGLTSFGDIAQCLVPLFANAGLLLNAGSPDWRRNAFWMLLALGCSLWMAGQLLWTYFEIYLHQPVPNPFAGDVIFFLHVVPMIAALALQPDQRQADRGLRFGYLDFTLLLLWWVYLYLFIVIPWQFVRPEVALYGHNYNVIYLVENLIFLTVLGMLWLRTTGPWRVVYANLFGAGSCYAISSLVINVAIDQQTYYTGSLYDIPLVASLVWFGTSGIVAYRICPDPGPTQACLPSESQAVAGRPPNEGVWPARLAMAAVLSLPLLAAWAVFASEVPPAVREFRLRVTLASIVPLTALVFFRQRLVDQDRLRLLAASEGSVENLKRLQTHFVQAEKLASLGQLAAGAAHEINNPLTAILGYSDLLIDDPTAGERAHTIGEKIREQARRTKTLVTHLLSFARQVPAERTLLDANAVVTSAVQLRGLDLRGKNIHIELHTESVLPGVRGDPNQLLQVFFNIISNAVDAMEEVGGGKLTVRTLRDRTNVVIEFSDTGPGIQEPHLVFDPFYTTKPVGKGTGLGLSICYGLVQEHGGSITCFNRHEGGATFRIQIPAVLALFPVRDATPVPPSAVKSS
ncbi:MAG: HAMP domain-containing histidine kinase [Acidobacteria bacterium]|nr:HAMP domain-containing histidine kinase [Acidobacteriota bacterium]